VRILMIHPHDIYSLQEPWTVRITYLAGEMVRRGHEVKLVYHLLDPTLSLAEAAARQEHPFETIPAIRHSFSLVSKTLEMVRLARWADIVHFQKCFTYVSLPAITAAYLNGIPVHYDWDDWEYGIYNYRPLSHRVGRFIDFTERALPRLVDTVSVASAPLRQMCLELGVPEERIFEAHVGADLQRFRPNVDGTPARSRHDLVGPVVMYLGQLHGAQYCELFLHAARRIVRERRDVTFVVVGTGHRFGELHRLSEQLKIGDALVFTGAVEHERVPEYLAAADVVVACFADTPQVRCKSPLKICEYLAAGKAIVASDVGEVTRMVGDAGVLTKANDVVSLADGVCRLLDDPALRVELGLRARRRAEDEYNWGVTAENLLRAYAVGIDRHARRWRVGGRGAPHHVESLEAPLPQGPAVPRDLVRDNLDLVGVIDGEHAFVGPRLVQLDVTNNCNNDCIACWCNSPLLHGERMSPEVKRQSLGYERIVGLLDELHTLGTREIYMAGGGEPFMHPRIEDVVAAVKARGMGLYINTNFTLIDERRVDLLVSLGVDHLTVSVWAGSPGVYARTHPNKTEETFEQMRRMLHRLRERKGGRGHAPFVKLYNVISHLNYRDVDAMFDFAREVQVESMELTVVDTKPGYTDCLLLNDEQRRELHGRCTKIAERVEREKIGLDLFRFDQFLRRVSSSDGRGNYDQQVVDSLPCTIGWTFARVLPDGNVNPCLKAHRYPLGNIHHASFRDIWSSPRQYEFRRQTNQLKKKGEIFRLIGNDPTAEVGCYRGCDDLGRNEFTYGRYKELSLAERARLAAAARYLRRRGRYV
jgi:glycosyltransferase involved in cell wall biosynthesis/MoaA/NifB/PqqE/SkfB family radical SAM enzyme